MSGVRFSSVATAIAIIVVCGGTCAVTTDVQARQYVAVGSSGDPGDGWGAAPSGGSYGHLADDEYGDPTDGEGRATKVGNETVADVGPGEYGDPGDGEEVFAIAVTAGDAPEGLTLILLLTAVRILGHR